jgi:predicted MFS family arabinose efflux permease
MMSINSAAIYLGNALGAGVGGLILLWYNWNLLGIALGALGIAATVIYHRLAIDPTRSKQAK